MKPRPNSSSRSGRCSQSAAASSKAPSSPHSRPRTGGPPGAAREAVAELREGVRRVFDRRRDVRLHRGVAEVRREADAQGGERLLEGRRVGEPRRRQAGRIPRRGAGREVEQQRRVCDGLGERPVHRRVLEVPVRERPARHASVGRLQAEAAGEARRDADRAAAVARRDERADAARERRRRAAARAARRALEIPGRARDAVDEVAGDRGVAELRRVGLADDDRAGVLQPLHLDLGGVGDPVAIDRGCRARGAAPPPPRDP